MAPDTPTQGHQRSVRHPNPPPIERAAKRPDRMWPLDVSIAALAGLVLFLIVTRLRFDDPRWLFNAWTYLIAVPVIAFVLANLSHGIASRYVQKSIQLGFLFSVFVHLLLLILAINVIIFSRYFPDAFTGVKPERAPVRRTVPEYLFQTPTETAATPDWSQPVEAETTSRVIPEQQRQLPPVQHSAPKLEIPRPREPEQRPMQKFLMKRDQPSESQPQPADSPAKLARQRSANSEAMAQSMQSPTAPEVPAEAEVQAESIERQITPRQRTLQSTANLSSAAATDVPLREQPQRSLAGARNRSTEMPTVGESGQQRERRQRTRADRMQPAGSAPAPQTVAIAQEVESAERMLAPVDMPSTRSGQNVGAQLTTGDLPSLSLPDSSPATAPGSDLKRNNLAAQSGMPNITAGQSQRPPGRTSRQTTGVGFEPAGTPGPAQSISVTATQNETDVGDEIGDRLGSSDAMSELRSRQRGGSISPSLSSASASGITLDILVDGGPAGLATQSNPVAGVLPTDSQPEVAALDLTRGSRPRREVGGPVTPFGSKIAAVESFNRRVMRTKGGAAPTPAGMVGPATEEAIERGLAYLASIQNEDGSWSLQGHGSKVLLRSDAAATGLCLLAFQGAGYTHRQHQYADTVSRGLKFLLDNQRTNGNLYRNENRLSDNNVALYSHGIASLALCEAYGMTQDAELKEPAQASLNYIINTQHRQRGGWRYTPQVSADTSVTGWMMMALKSGQLSGLDVSQDTYQGIARWLGFAQQSPDRQDRYRYNPYAPDTPTQRHGKTPTPTMTSVGILMRMYLGWQRDKPAMRSAADYLLRYPPQMGTRASPQRDAYYWYYATQVMFHMGGNHWYHWNRQLNPVLLDSQVKDGPKAGSWDPMRPVPDRWSQHAGRLYVTTMNLLNLEVYYRHLPIYEDTAQ